MICSSSNIGQIWPCYHSARDRYVVRTYIAFQAFEAVVLPILNKKKPAPPKKKEKDPKLPADQQPAAGDPAGDNPPPPPQPAEMEVD